MYSRGQSIENTVKVYPSRTVTDSGLCLRLYCADFQEPYAVVVLLEKDLVVIDLAQNG